MPDSRRKQLITQAMILLGAAMPTAYVDRILNTPWKHKEQGGTFPAYLLWGASEEKAGRTGGATGGSKTCNMKLGVRVLTEETASGSAQVLLDNAMQGAENALEDEVNWRATFPWVISARVTSVGVATYTDEDGMGWGIGDLIFTIEYNQGYGAQ